MTTAASSSTPVVDLRRRRSAARGSRPRSGSQPGRIAADGDEVARRRCPARLFFACSTDGQSSASKTMAFAPAVVGEVHELRRRRPPRDAHRRRAEARRRRACTSTNSGRLRIMRTTLVLAPEARGAAGPPRARFIRSSSSAERRGSGRARASAGLSGEFARVDCDRSATGSARRSRARRAASRSPGSVERRRAARSAARRDAPRADALGQLARCSLA